MSVGARARTQGIKHEPCRARAVCCSLQTRTWKRLRLYTPGREKHARRRKDTDLPGPSASTQRLAQPALRVRTRKGCVWGGEGVRAARKGRESARLQVGAVAH